ncbi:MAG: hypothetical protein CL896_02465 [Dehalococcoidia bacterium]|nr:hypothetical protein [Dehalococcoidia bacterium]
MSDNAAGLDPRSILKEFKKNKISHLVWLPDSETNFMYQVMTSDKDLTVVPVCREAETIAIAAGLQLGGKRTVVLVQNTGIFESGDSIRGIALDLNLPLLLLIGYRGWVRHGITKDSAAFYTEHFLHSWGIDYYLIESDSDAHLISHALSSAEANSKPVAVLLGREYS